MGEMMEFKRVDGKTCPGYLATPKEGSSAPGCVVIQEWWGLNDRKSITKLRIELSEVLVSRSACAGPLSGQDHHGRR